MFMGNVEQWDVWSNECSHKGWNIGMIGALNVRALAEQWDNWRIELTGATGCNGVG